MWVKFLAKPYAARILADRTAFYYFPDEVLDLPRAWADEHIARGEAEEAEGPAEFTPPTPFLPPSLGDDILTVACVWRTGGLYDGQDYVGRLARAVARHLPGRYRFVCLTDAPEEDLPEGVEHIPLLHDWPGFWAKIELFRPGLFAGPVLYFDLDTVICGDLTPFAEATQPVLAAWDLNRGWLNSSMVRWSVDLSAVYDRMVAEPDLMRAKYGPNGQAWGDQGLLQDTLVDLNIPFRWMQQAFPDLVHWHPYGTRTQPAPEGVAVSLWFGQPKMHEVESDWLRTHWR